MPMYAKITLKNVTVVMTLVFNKAHYNQFYATIDKIIDIQYTDRFVPLFVQRSG